MDGWMGTVMKVEEKGSVGHSSMGIRYESFGDT